MIQETKEGFPLSLKFFECFQLQIMSATKTVESLFLRQRDPPKPFPIIFADDTHIVFILTLSEIIKYNLDKQIIIERCNYPSSVILSTYIWISFDIIKHKLYSRWNDRVNEGWIPNFVFVPSPINQLYAIFRGSLIKIFSFHTNNH